MDIAPEILAELEQKQDQANALALSLMAKENELEHLQGDLKVGRYMTTAFLTPLSHFTDVYRLFHLFPKKTTNNGL